MTTTSSTKLSFSDRAGSESASPLTRYLLSLISIKQSNLCVSADVHTTEELLQLADQVGDHICILKIHADIIDDFSERTIRGLQDLSKRRHFLIFEDRKFGDIGNTLQLQYTRGPLRIAQWAHIVNAHLLPGPSVISSLQEAANEALFHLNQSVATTISSGPMESESSVAATDFAEPNPDANDEDSDGVMLRHHRTNSRTAMATTTISQTVEATSPSRPPAFFKSISHGEGDRSDPMALAELGPPPHARGLLLLAQMSNTGNLCTPEYTATCVKAAKDHQDFVLGFIGQEDLAPGSDLLTLTPGVGLPKAGSEGANVDGKGQVWRTPEEVVSKDRVDVIIVGRGILQADDRKREAERYRKAAWTAYERLTGTY